MIEGRRRSPAAPGRDPLEYLEAPLRYPRAMWIPFTVVLAIALLLAFVFPRKYRSATLILVEPNKVPTTCDPDGVRDGGEAPADGSPGDPEPHPPRGRGPGDRPLPGAGRGSPGVVVEAMRRAIQIRRPGQRLLQHRVRQPGPPEGGQGTNRLASSSSPTPGTCARRRPSGRSTSSSRTWRTRGARSRSGRWRSAGSSSSTGGRCRSSSTPASACSRSCSSSSRRSARTSARSRPGERRSSERLVELRGPGREAPSAGTDARAQLLELQAQYATLRERYKEEHPDVRALRLRHVPAPAADRPARHGGGRLRPAIDPRSWRCTGPWSRWRRRSARSTPGATGWTGGSRPPGPHREDARRGAGADRADPGLPAAAENYLASCARTRGRHGPEDGGALAGQLLPDPRPGPSPRSDPSGPTAAMFVMGRPRRGTDGRLAFAVARTSSTTP